tara:strand:+ start:462 stop:1082 length:621 start_codon:yes stop_codon:yes gene_type:complete
MKHGIALIPEQREIDILIEYQNELGKKFSNLRPILGKEVNVPHVTIFQGQFKKGFDHQAIFRAILEKYSLHLKNLWLQISDFEILNDMWLFLNVEDEFNILCSVQDDILKMTKGNMEISNSIPSYYSNIEKEYFEKYGYRFAKELFRPHITLGKIANLGKKEKKEIKHFTQEFLEMKKFEDINIENFVFHELGDGGSCEKIIQKYL